VAQSELDILHEKNNASQNALEEARARILAIQESRVVKEQELKDCGREMAKLSKQGQRVQSELDNMSQKESQFRSKVSGARQKADEAKASFAATQTQGNVLTGLMRLKESGRIEGFHVSHAPGMSCFGAKKILLGSSGKPWDYRWKVRHCHFHSLSSTRQHGCGYC
jgi:structural maintenance of chromosome 4